MINDVIALAHLAELDRKGALDGIKAMLEPEHADEEEERFLGDVASHLSAILGFCAALGTVRKGVGGLADMVELAGKLAEWLKSKLNGEDRAKRIFRTSGPRMG